MGSKNTDKKDYFGHPMKEKFPHYPYGVIIPRCTRGPCTRHKSGNSGQVPAKSRQSMTQSGPSNNSNTSKNRRAHDPHCTQAKNKNEGRNVSSREACRRIAKIVAEELPQCHFDKKFLQELECTCKNYWDALRKNSIYLDEQQVIKELKYKLHRWANERSHCQNDETQDETVSSRTTDNDDSRLKTPSHNSNNDSPQADVLDYGNESYNTSSRMNSQLHSFYEEHQVDEEVLDYFEEDEEQEEDVNGEHESQGEDEDLEGFRISRFPRSWGQEDNEEEVQHEHDE